MPEEGDYLGVKDVLAVVPRVLAQCHSHILEIDFDEVGEAHLHGTLLLALEGVLEVLCFSFALESALALMLALAVEVLVPELCRPCAVRLLCNTHWIPSDPPK